MVDADFELLETATKECLAYSENRRYFSYLVVVNLSDQEQDFCYDFERAEVIKYQLEPITDQGKLQKPGMPFVSGEIERKMVVN